MALRHPWSTSALSEGASSPVVKGSNVLITQTDIETGDTKRSENSKYYESNSNEYVKQ
jgi:hypothetical protein